MTETSFNYATHAFVRHAAHSGFWHHAEALAGPAALFDFRPVGATPQRSNASVSTVSEAPEPARPEQRPQRVHVAVGDLMETA